MKITVTMDVVDEFADPDHEMGVTTEGYDALIDALAHLGDDIDIRKADEQ